MLSNELDNCDSDESENPGYESGSAGAFGTKVGILSLGLGFPLGVTLTDNESCGGYGGSLALP